MKSAKLLVGCGTLLLAACGANETEQAETGVASEQPQSGSIEEAPAVPLVGPEGQILGEVHAGDTAEGVVLRVNAEGLSAGSHGMHIHQTGRCEGPDFASAGSHWNPDNKQHGLQNPQGPHRGDLPNVTVGDDGRLEATVTVEGSNLRGSRAYGFANQILDDDGAALVIHAQADDMQTDPSGESGDRIACAVLGGTTQPTS